MKARDTLRSRIKTAGHNKKILLLQKYKALRSKVTCLIRKENIDFYNNRALDPLNKPPSITYSFHQTHSYTRPAILPCIKSRPCTAQLARHASAIT